MLIPIADEPNPKGIPWMTVLLIAVNVLFYAMISYPLDSVPLDPRAPGAEEYLRHLEKFTKLPRGELLLYLSQYDLYVFRTGGLRPAHPTLLALLLSMFLHVGMGHLFGNMLYLWIFGNNVEHRLGGYGFLLAYLGTGICAMAPVFALASGSDISYLGASGAISGVLGLYFVWFPHHVITMVVWIGRPWFFQLEAWWVLVFYLLVSNVVPYYLAGDSLGVGHSVHIGGFLAGVLVAKAIDDALRPASASPRAPFVPMQRKFLQPESPLAPVRRELQKGSAQRAFELYGAIPPAARVGITQGEVCSLGDYLEESRQYSVALALYKDYIASEADPGEPAEIHLRAGLLLLEPLARPVEAVPHLELAARAGRGSSITARAAEALARAAHVRRE